MALDGIVIASIVNELKALLPIIKIEKIYQPEADELVMLVRSHGRNYKLLLSADSNYPRIHLMNSTKDNPSAAPNFCMLLRKHLQGGRITNISQPQMERIIELHIEAYDELNVLRQKMLIIEIMGKHSNIILIDSESKKIIDSIKRVSHEVSRYRQVLPGLTYQAPPKQDKLNPLTINSLDDFKNQILKDGRRTVIQSIYNSFIGISPLISRELCYTSNIEEDTPVLGLTPPQMTDLFKGFMGIIDLVNRNEYTPCTYFDEGLDKFVDFSCIRLHHLSSLKEEIYDNISDMLESYYRKRDVKERIKQKSQDIRKNLNTKLDRLYNKLENLKEDLKKAQRAEEYKIKGELITANLHLIKERQDRISVVNYYDEEMKEIVIELDKKLTPVQNSQLYYKQYNKYKTAVSEVNKQIQITGEEIAYIEEILMSIEYSTHLTDLEEIQKELAEAGIIKGKTTKKTKEQPKKSKFLKYLSSDGYEIYVGKNNNQNDEITFKVASKGDIWLHVKDLAGSHTILKVKDGEYSKKALFEAATLAAYYSKGRNSTKIPVDYTLRKNVRKPSGAKAGRVIYDYYETLLVDANLKDIKDIQEIE